MASLLADLILVVHLFFITFVIVGQGCIVVGGFLRWAWVRRFGFRVAHLVAIGIVALQAWLGVMCPLTVWENTLRREAGQDAYGESLIAHWVGELIYYDAPAWVFTMAYTVFGLLVLASWFLVKPVRRRRATLKRSPDAEGQR